ncbi:putative s-adenosylmethionine-dependent methyltransferase-like protein [Rosellinia necatrix]|uniref:protein-histidine N-methyltransferase n=1 Tax=Rosellinia necatrix TaxID=77044 RepID=A0A1S7UMB8_ROSNE|nr:putative s-adenosylmethionine-dependent methyltransferase-like protein [Rosellinia necatrix]
MSGQFSFSFSGEDIEVDDRVGTQPSSHAVSQPPASTSAFPVAGKPLLPATSHDVKEMLSRLPSKVAFGLLDVDLDGQGTIQLPRRELWDVRVQLMAEEDEGETEPGLGNHDVKTGVYEGGFKSWESSVDLVKVFASSHPFAPGSRKFSKIVELGCGTGLPSLALFQWAMGSAASSVSFILADYNPSVLQLVTLPNFILAWAIHHREGLPLLSEAFSPEGELDLTPEILEAFQQFLSTHEISLLFFSGAWSPEFVGMVTNAQNYTDGSSSTEQATVIIGAETIYSPFALSSFLQTILALLEHEKTNGRVAEALVGAKRLYFGVGGSLDDFVVQARGQGATVVQLREETEGVRRGVVRCSLP